MAETEAEASSGAYVSERALAALRNTRAWALCAGVVALLAAALAVINGLFSLLVWPSELPANASPYLASLTRDMTIVGIVGALIAYGLSGWFALQYGRGLGASLRDADAARLEAALWWQRRYWTLQGVLTIVFIAIFVLGMIAAIIVGAILAKQHGA